MHAAKNVTRIVLLYGSHQLVNLSCLFQFRISFWNYESFVDIWYDSPDRDWPITKPILAQDNANVKNLDIYILSGIWAHCLSVRDGVVRQNCCHCHLYIYTDCHSLTLFTYITFTKTASNSHNLNCFETSLFMFNGTPVCFFC
jgi:hypothetical protein